jgi:hypothetical protein
VGLLYNSDVWGVIELVKGGASDDVFSDFCAWVIAQGRSITTLAVTKPDEFALTLDPSDEMSCEAMLYAGPTAYEILTGNEGPPPRSLPILPASAGDQQVRPIAPWGSYDEMAAYLRLRLPRAYARCVHDEAGS